MYIYNMHLHVLDTYEFNENYKIRNILDNIGRGVGVEIYNNNNNLQILCTQYIYQYSTPGPLGFFLFFF